MKKRLLAIFMAALLLAGSTLMLFSCTDETEKPNNSVTSDSNDDTTEFSQDQYLDILDARQGVKETLPDGLDFGEAEVRIAVQADLSTDVWAEPNTGSMVDDEIANRKLYVEELLNVQIVEPYMHNSFWMLGDEIMQMVNSGDSTYDLYLGHAVYTGSTLVSGNYYINLLDDDIKYLNFENPWYPQDIIDELSINGQMYVAASDMTLSLTSCTYCMYYDKVAAANYNLPDIYEIIDNGEWTLDKLYELTKDIYVDENKNNVADEFDFYGFASDQQSAVNTFMWSCDQPIWDYDPDTFEFINTFNTEKTESIIEKIRQLFNSPGSSTSTEFSWGGTLFQNQQTIFCTGVIGASIDIFSEIDDYGIIPYPKYDAAQEKYYTMVDGLFSLIAIPLTCKDVDMVCAVIEAMSAYSWKNVLPLYYDLALKVRGTRDDQSIKMLDTIMEGRIVDFQYIYDQGYAFDPQKIIQNGNDFSSYVATYLPFREKAYEKALEYFALNG